MNYTPLVTFYVSEYGLLTAAHLDGIINSRILQCYTKLLNFDIRHTDPLAGKTKYASMANVVVSQNEAIRRFCEDAYYPMFDEMRIWYS